MRCPRCDKENPSGAAFCVFCGAPLTGIALAEELREVKRVLVRLSDRVAALEQRLGVPTLAEAPREPVAPPGAAATGAPAEAVLAGAGAGPTRPQVEYWSAPAAAAPESASPTAPPPSEGSGIDWERVLGMNWFAIIGAVALAIGVGFFLRLAFQNNWIGVTGRIVLGIVIGLALLGLAEYFRRRYPTWAQAVTGGGLAILYLSIYAAFGLYELIAPQPALLFLALVVLLSGLLALRYESLVIALLSIGGAFLTPVLLGGELKSNPLLLAYLLLVDGGILGISTFRNWRWFTLLGMGASYALFAVWLEQVPAQDLVLAEGGLTGIFLIFVGATSLFHVLWRRMPGPADMALITINAAAYFALTFDLLWPKYSDWFGFISLGLSLFYGMVGYAAIQRSGAPPQVALFALATALVFLTVAAPLQLTGQWITVAWAAEGAVLLWVGFVLRTWQARAFALGVFGMAAFRLLIFDTPVELAGFRPVLNDRFPTFVVAIAAFAIGAYLYRRELGRLEKWEANVSLVLVGVANLLALWLFSAEVIAFFDSRELAARSVLARQNAENGKLLTLTALWAIYALGLLAVALGTRSAPWRWAGVALLSTTVLKLLLFDTFFVNLDPLTFRPVLNFQFLIFLVVLAAVVFAAYLYWRQRAQLSQEDEYIFPALLIVANFIALWALSAEAIRFFDSREAQLRSDLASAKHLSLTILWAVYAVGVIAAGILRRSSVIRLAGIGLLGVPVLKLFVFDVFLLERGYKVTAFITLGAMLLAMGLVYQRYSHAVRGFLFGKPA